MNINTNINNYGFIITRHVNSELTNKYWNRCVRCIRKFYPLKRIVIIDDNSNQDFVKPDHEYRNIEVIASEFPGRGELLPYYYFYKHRFFNNAVIIHDSVFFHQRINFDKIKSKAIPLWHFNRDKENLSNTFRLASVLQNNHEIMQSLDDKNLQILGFKKDAWYGCFGVQSYINWEFLAAMQNRYAIFNLLSVVTTRSDRCCLERIFGYIFFKNQPYLYKRISLLGNIMTYCVWGGSFENYIQFVEKKKVSLLPLVKVWTGR